MTYYDELGLGQDATVGQIRQVHRSLARLLHPDRQADDTLSRLAESQMKRVNSIHNARTDPPSRQVRFPILELREENDALAASNTEGGGGEWSADAEDGADEALMITRTVV